jgi:hypothetical protein
MTKGYVEQLRQEIAKKFDTALAVGTSQKDPQEQFKQKADRLIKEALKARP